MGGERDSSKTRVAPVFDQLCGNDATDGSRLPKLLALPEFGSRLDIPSSWDFTIEETRWGEDEKRLDPPVSLLSWLIRNVTMQAGGDLSSDPVKAGKRQELINRSTERVREALGLLRHNPACEDWHIFEGASQPDVFIETPDVMMVVEGKRTEARPTRKTKWMAIRDQMLRHIDCAWEIRGSRHVIGLMVVEGVGDDTHVPTLWQAEAKETVEDETVRGSLPHRGPEEQQKIADCFIGVTTWQRVCAEFGLDWSKLPNTV